MGDGVVRLVTWNLQGRLGVDVAAVAAVVAAVDPDIVALQEVQLRQAWALGAALAMPSRRWVFKHWPVVSRSEGLAVLTRHQLLGAVTFTLRRAPFWDWRRRVGIDAIVGMEQFTARLLVVHLSPHDDGERRREAGVTLRRAADGSPPIITGDLNDLPGDGAHAAFVEAGWIDAWRAANPGDAGDAGSTNWTSGGRRGRPPTQRIDYVLAPPGSRVEHCCVLGDEARFDELAGLSDHLPLAATIRLPEAP